MQEPDSVEMAIVKNNLKEKEDLNVSDCIPEEGSVRHNNSAGLTAKVRGSDDKVEFKSNGPINTTGLMKLEQLRMNGKIIDKKTEILLKYDGEDYAKDKLDALNNEEINDLVNPILYTRGVPSDCFYLVLRGKVMVVSGREGFQVELGEFNSMGIDALSNDEFTPDFSAKVIGQARVL